MVQGSTIYGDLNPRRDVAAAPMAMETNSRAGIVGGGGNQSTTGAFSPCPAHDVFSQHFLFHADILIWVAVIGIRLPL